MRLHLTYTEKANDGENCTFHFDRLNVRAPTLLISPRVQQGLIRQAIFCSELSVPALLSNWSLSFEAWKA